ncbi:MAG TPA: hypothetical protein VM253_02310 [Candidatus Limnocylindrales bacterium]|nr:hypothetical protein [Candidatus Limnocylindrales bacterium]
MDRDTFVGGGGMTGATGDLTPEEPDRQFDPGERREMDDPVHHADMTDAQGRRAPAQLGETGDVTDRPEGGPTNMASRDDGYGSHHGLSPDDPAYRMESHPTPPSGEEDAGPQRDRTQVGGDEISEGEERF